MKFALPVVCLALSIPSAVVAAAASSGRLQGGGSTGSIQAEKATAAEAAIARATRSLETKPGGHAVATSRGLRSAGAVSASTKAAFFQDVVSKAQQEKQHRALAGTCDMEQTLTKLQPTDDPMFTSRQLEFGNNLAIDGDWMVTGVAQNSSSPYQAIWIYKWDGSDWIFHQKIEYPANTNPAGFGKNVAISGDTIAVSAWGDMTVVDRGAVFVYRLDAADNDQWKQEAFIANPAGGTSWFGQYLRVEGDTLVVPALTESSNRGAVYFYERDCSSGTCSWSQTQKLAGENAGDVFGSNVALSGNSLFIGDRTDFDGITDAGQVNYYTRTEAGGQWTLQQSFTPSNVVADDQFGAIMAFDGGTTLFVPTARRVVDGVWGVGYGWIYELNPSTGEWEVTQELENNYGGIDFGAYWPVLRGDTLAIPVPRNGGGIQVWKKVGGSWAVEKYFPKDERCIATAFHDDSLVFGCSWADGKKGAVYYLTCPDAFPAAAADGGSVAASGAGETQNDETTTAASYVGETQTLDEALAAAGEAATTVDEFFTARSAYEVASHDLDVATTQLEDATTAHAEAQAKATALTKEYDQAVAYEATMKKASEDATARAEATDATAAERHRLPIEAEIAYNEATAVRVEAEAAKDAAVAEEAAALVAKEEATLTKDTATATEAAAKTALDTELAEVNANLLIPKINPATLDFPYVDTDGDLIPNDFDACPTQMGLRRNTAQRTSSDNPGPQDFCPSGCPETGADGTTVLDSDGDGINDCEDRCPFEAGIEYNHAWTFATKDDFSSLDRNLDYHGCPDRDGDGIPDKFDACPTQAGGECYSGCPDKGIDPVTQKAYDGDMDGVSDCNDRCPGFYGPGTMDGCPDGDFDGTPDYRDYCPSNPGEALFAYQRKLEGDAQKYMNILGCPDEDGDLVTDQADICDAPAYPNQDAATFTGLTRVAVVNNKGCPLDSDQDGVYDGIDNCDGTVHSANPVHDPRAIVFSPTDDGFSAANDQTKLGCPKDTDNDGVADGIDQCPTEGGYIGRDGCPIDSDKDGVKDCISTEAPASYTWPFVPTDCHSTSAKPDASCCTVEEDMCANTVRGATVYSKEYTHPKLDASVAPGCSFDTDKDGVVDGVDLCPYTTDVEIALAESNPEKVSIDDSGCATMSAAMWESTFVDVTTGSEGANPKVELLFTVDALLPQIATSRKYDVANELVAVQVMDASCTNTFDDETDAGDKLLPATITVNNPGLFTGQTPTGSIPITIDVNLNPDNVVGSEVWTTEPPFDVGSIDFCLGFAVLSDTEKSVTYKELKTTILIDMTQDFAVTDISVERNEAEETTKLIDIEYPLAACQCTTDNTCVDDSALDDSFLSQSDSLKLCVRFAPDAENNDELPPDYVQMTDVKSFTCNQGGLSISPIVNFERQGDGGQLTSVETINKELGSGESYTTDDRMLIVNTRLPATFFGAEERPVDCVGTIVYEFAAGSVIDPDLVGQRLLSEASMPLTPGQTGRRDAEEAPEAEAESEFSVEVMLAKAAGGRSLGVIAGAAVASALVVASGAAVTTMAIRRGGSSGVPKMSNAQPSTQQQSWAETSASTQEEGRAFTIANGAVA